MKHLEHFHELKSLTRKQKFFLLSLLPVYFMVIGLFLQPIQEIGPGIVRLIKDQWKPEIAARRQAKR